MGWERRGRGRYYYYKRREGGRVVSQYAGSGPVAQAIAAQQAQDTRLWEGIRAQARLERAQDAELDAAIERAGAAVQALVTAALLANGYHAHKRSWRKRRKHADE